MFHPYKQKVYGEQLLLSLTTIIIPPFGLEENSKFISNIGISMSLCSPTCPIVNKSKEPIEIAGSESFKNDTRISVTRLLQRHE